MTKSSSYFSLQKFFFRFFPLGCSSWVSHSTTTLTLPPVPCPCLILAHNYTKMRGVQIFSGTSHPTLAKVVCDRLGTQPARADLGKFANGETSVNIGVSVRNQDVYIVQSGSEKINDSVMELLIMISACKGGSAKSITGMFHEI